MATVIASSAAARIVVNRRCRARRSRAVLGPRGSGAPFLGRSSRPIATLFVTALAAGVVTAFAAVPSFGRRRQIQSSRERIVSAAAISEAGETGTGADATRDAA